MAEKKKRAWKGRIMPPRILHDMRYVYEHPESEDKTEQQRVCRIFLNTDKKAFIQRLADLEKHYSIERAKKKAAFEKVETGSDMSGEPRGSPDTVDEKSVAIEALIDQLLAECTSV